MRFDTIIRNGTIVTATDTYAGDVALANGLITAIGKDLPIENADKILDAKDGLVIPAVSTCTRISICRLAARRALTISSPGRAPRLLAARQH